MGEALLSPYVRSPVSAYLPDWFLGLSSHRQVTLPSPDLSSSPSHRPVLTGSASTSPGSLRILGHPHCTGTGSLPLQLCSQMLQGSQGVAGGWFVSRLWWGEGGQARMGSRAAGWDSMEKGRDHE